MQKRAALNGFTLIEIMLVVALTGIIAAAALAPLVFTVSSLQDAQKTWSKRVKDRAAVDGIFSDVRGALDVNSWKPIRVLHKSGLSVGDDDRLLVFSSSPMRTNKPAGLIVYRVVADSPIDNTKGGLYRWVISGGIKSADVTAGSATLDPINLDTDKLQAPKGKIVIPNAEGLRLSVWADSKWSDEYEGGLPEALRVSITVKGKRTDYEDWFPKISK
jgi:prepilin-type N-terminal cleavage/methylation domain-containing protein